MPRRSIHASILHECIHACPRRPHVHCFAVSPNRRSRAAPLVRSLTSSSSSAPYHKLDSVALVGSCLVRSLSASADLPQVQPPGPVRLVPIFTERPHPTVPVTIGLGGVGAAAAAPTAPLAGYDPSWVDPDEYLTREMREAREATKEAGESKQAIEDVS